MVGDVKQSIYKFRQARPELFLDKYKNYSLQNANEKGLKIQLFKNFRSRQNVLEFTNEIFEYIYFHGYIHCVTILFASINSADYEFILDSGSHTGTFNPSWPI